MGRRQDGWLLQLIKRPQLRLLTHDTYTVIVNNELILPQDYAKRRCGQVMKCAFIR